jgi:aldose 1-epimerase
MAGIEIATRAARVVIRPDLGAGLQRYDLLDRGEVEPLFRPAARDVEHPFDLANILLVPWSGRISGGGFTFDGVFHALEPNLPTEAFPIHGNGFSSVWTVQNHDDAAAELRLEANGPGPFRYDATVIYRLDDGALTMELAVTNEASIPLPYGGGFHPWFPRGRDARLKAGASTAWLEDENHLPASSAPVTPGSRCDFSIARPLATGWTHVWFSDWDGKARIEWPDRQLALDIEASGNLSSCVLYSPSEEAGFLCFEPVSHPVDAHNLGQAPQDFGLIRLAPGDTFGCSARFAPTFSRSE